MHATDHQPRNAAAGDGQIELHVSALLLFFFPGLAHACTVTHMMPAEIRACMHHSFIHSFIHVSRPFNLRTITYVDQKRVRVSAHLMEACTFVSSYAKKGYKSGRSLGQPSRLLSAGCRQCSCDSPYSPQTFTLMVFWAGLHLYARSIYSICMSTKMFRSTVHDLKNLRPL